MLEIALREIKQGSESRDQSKSCTRRPGSGGKGKSQKKEAGTDVCVSMCVYSCIST